jgi:predicted dehydrogenase
MAQDPIRFGIIGMGGVGVHHARYLPTVEGAALTAFSTRDAARRAAAAAEFPHARAFASQAELLRSGLCDAVIIATPHYQHVDAVSAALEAGLHVLVEKPLAVTLSDCRRALAAAARRPDLLFGIMLNQRSHPAFSWLRGQIRSGALGELQRLSWTATHWFRANVYYASSPWRATWAGEGGGLLINQCHHNLDLLCWMTGLQPRRVTAVGFLGKRHPIETEDEFSAIFEYDSGMIGHFYATTGEFPGVNRLEIAGSRARVA